MKFVDGLMIHSGDPCNDYVDTATRHVLLRQGVLGIKVGVPQLLIGNVIDCVCVQVKIMLPFDPNGKNGPKRPLPDNVSVVEPKEETLPTGPSSDIKPIKADLPPVAVV